MLDCAGCWQDSPYRGHHLTAPTVNWLGTPNLQSRYRGHVAKHEAYCDLVPPENILNRPRARPGGGLVASSSVLCIPREPMISASRQSSLITRLRPEFTRVGHCVSRASMGRKGCEIVPVPLSGMTIGPVLRVATLPPVLPHPLGANSILPSADGAVGEDP